MLTQKKLFVLAALSLASLGMVAGCTTDVDSDDGVVEESEADLSKAGKALIGSYRDDSGPFRGLILTANKAGQANEFIADVDTGIACIMAPCPSSERITGTFTAGAKTITFKSSTVSPYAKHLLGRYNYRVQGHKLSLSRKNFAQSLEEVISYCAQPADCWEQNLILPACLGSFTCSTQNTCSWNCGSPKPPPPSNACAGLAEEQCTSTPGCQPKYGPSACTPDGICTADVVYTGCEGGESGEGAECFSSSTCAAGQHCSTEDGVCNAHGMLAVCAGTCVSSGNQ